ncbi:hypothetical protein [Halobaculum sp. D14]|uniref:hypothetical protein n=1 Tax=unclassified Halobaculum TaxID=2640896 RepID=UPI003EBE233A
MNVRRFVAAYPVPVVLTLAFAVAVVATAVSAAAGAAGDALRFGALAAVLFVFAAGFWLGPAEERYL